MERRIRVLHHRQDARSFMTHFAKSDGYRVGDVWYSGGEDWLHGYNVDEVRKPMGLGFAVGDTMVVRNVQGEHLETFIVEAIEMHSLDESDNEFREKNPLFDVKRGWLVIKTQQ